VPCDTDTDTVPVSDDSYGAPPTAGDTPSSFGQTCLDVHNKYRAMHSAPALKWDNTMANYALNHVKTGGCHMQHSKGPYGENLGIGFSDVKSCIDAWYKEESKYNYGSGGFSSATGHFTQVVWKNAKKIGCAQWKCGHGYYISCNYDTGNVIGSFKTNVLPN